jgi:SM-20-related protein
MHKPQVIDNYFPTKFYDLLRTFIEAQPMMFGAKSNSRTDPHGHWSWKPFTDSTHNLADISAEIAMASLRPLWEALQIVRSKLPDGMKLIRCYVNGYSYGDDGYFHTDSDRDGDITVIIYICGPWERDWAGETVIVHDKTYYSYQVVPNRMVIIGSNTLHAARAVSRKCTQLRRTLMFKCRPRRSQEFEHLSQFLVSHGAHKIDHAQGSLHDHLVRVYELLEKRSVPASVAYGGGLHSIYGTNAFKTKLMEPHQSTRAMVAGVFGQEAEELAYRFSLLDRPQGLENPLTTGKGTCYVPMRFQENAEISFEYLNRLRFIECANLVDQGSLEKWPNLTNLWSPRGEQKGYGAS